MKDGARQEKFQADCRKCEHEIRQDAGGQQVRGAHRSNVEAAQNALLAKRDESDAEPPKTAHDVKCDHRSQEIGDQARLAFGENSRIEKKHADREDRAEKEKHAIAQSEQNAHAGKCGEVSQSRSLLPVISMKTSSREGEAISRLTSSLPSASRCLTRSTIVLGGRSE